MNRRQRPPIRHRRHQPVPPVILCLVAMVVTAIVTALAVAVAPSLGAPGEHSRLDVGTLR